MQSLEEWHFDFGLMATGTEPIPEAACEDLWDVIIAWAEARGLGIGGGYRPFEDEPSGS